MASSSAQITLGNFGVTKFNDLNGDNWRLIYDKGEQLRSNFVKSGTVRVSDLFDHIKELQWLVTLALFNSEKES
jgi:hypothetical protein